MKKLRDEKRLVFKGKLLKLFIEQKTIPNGYRAYLETIRHPGAVLIVPFLGRGKVILIRQYRGVIDSFVYELPAGTLGKNEKPPLCAKRELIEETGYRAGEMTYVGKIYPAPGYSDELIHIFRADKLQKTKRLTQADEVIENRIMSRSQIRSLLKRGQMVDAKTISALAFCGFL